MTLLSKNRKANVLLVLEGSYPFAGGGISTWAHQLTHKVKNAFYIIYSINASLEADLKYELSENTKDVIQVPLWAPDEPHDYINYGKKYYLIVLKRELTTEQVVQEKFIPVFKRLIDAIFEESYQEVKNIDAVFYDMWCFFQTYDFKLTMKSKAVWKAYKDKIITKTANDYKVSIEDLVVGLRWLYRFLIPLSIDVPKADISHLTLSGFPLIPALVLNYKYKTPILITEHGVFIRERLIAINSSEYSYFLKTLLIKFSECITKLAYYKADMILSVNKFNTHWEKLYGASQSKISVVYNGVDHNLFIPRKKPNHLKNIPVVVAAARVFELKDILTMIRSCNEVRKIIPNVRYIVYGNKNAVPAYTQECEALIDELNLADNFELAGYHSKPELIYAEGDISILTSISEGFPFTVIESMSSGIPVVATDVGGVSEALEDGVSGYICKPKDYKGIANRVVALLTDDKLRSYMSINARKRVEKDFTIQKFIKGYEQVYETILNKKEKEKKPPIKKPKGVQVIEKIH